MTACQKLKHLELDLRGSDETLLSMLEYGADPKEMEDPGAAHFIVLLYSAAQPLHDKPLVYQPDNSRSTQTPSAH